MSALSGYYEKFRRATRSGARDPGAGRARKKIEDATDFALDDIVYSPRNGVPGQVILKLGLQKEQANWLAEDRVRDTLTTFLTIGEWAAGKDAVSELRVDDAETRTRAAVQVRRLLPRGALKSVSFGGKLLSRTLPVTLRADHESRILDVVSELTPPEPFDMTDQIRAIDLDRGVLLLGKARLPCYLRPELLQAIAQVGIAARVVGQPYRPLKGPAFVLANDAEEAEPSTDDGT